MRYDVALGNQNVPQRRWWLSSNPDCHTNPATNADGEDASGSLTNGAGQTFTWNNITPSQNLCKISVGATVQGSFSDSVCDSASFVITGVTLSGTGPNPFNPPTQSYYGWLSKKTISGIDYLYYNDTSDFFNTVNSTQVAHFDSSLVY